MFVSLCVCMSALSLCVSLQTKLKAERSRQKTVETLQKAAHSQRTEAAQNRREEKRRAEKERMMNEDDPDKQRKLEVRMSICLSIIHISTSADIKVYCRTFNFSI